MSKTKKSLGSETFDQTMAFKLMCLDDIKASELISLGETILLESVIHLHLADASGNALIEVAPLSPVATVPEVKIDGRSVLDVSHLQPHQILEINQLRYVLLPPMGIHVNRRDESVRWESILKAVNIQKGKNLASKTLQRQLWEHSNIQPNSNTSGTLRRLAPLAFGCLGFGAFGLSFVQHKLPPNAVSEQIVHEQPQLAVPEKTPEPALAFTETNEAHETSSNSPAPETLAAPVAAIPAFAAKSTPHDDTLEEQPKALTTTVKVKEPGAVNSKAQRSVSHAPRALAAKEKSPDAVKLDSPKMEAIQRLIESYQLESGFDPEGAKNKLKALRKKIRGNTALEREIDRVLKTIKE
jgi:hypothetical protein